MVRLLCDRVDPVRDRFVLIGYFNVVGWLHRRRRVVPLRLLQELEALCVILEMRPHRDVREAVQAAAGQERSAAARFLRENARLRAALAAAWRHRAP